MPDGVQLPVVLVLGYLLGAVPFAWLIVRLGFGLDLRAHGSRNVGATNAARVAAKGRRGVWIGVFAAVFLLDAAKGLAAVAGASALAPAHAHAPVGAGVAAILGHAYPVWLRFRGGKGVATSLGVFGWLAPVPTAIATGVFAAVTAITRYASAGSIAAAVALPAAHVWREGGAAFGAAWPATVLCLGVGVFVIVKHRANIGRLLAGTEGRVGDAAPAGPAGKANPA